MKSCNTARSVTKLSIYIIHKTDNIYEYVNSVVYRVNDNDTMIIIFKNLLIKLRFLYIWFNSYKTKL